MKVIGLMNEIYNGNTDLPNKIKVDNVIFHKDYVGDTIEYYNYNNNSNPDGILMQDYFKENYNTKAFLKLEVEEVEDGKWKPKKGEKYYYINTYGDIDEYICNDDFIDNYFNDTRNRFKTEEEAKQHQKNIKTEIELRELAEKLNNGEKIDWKNLNQYKYYLYVCYDTSFEEFIVDYGMTKQEKNAKQIYCLNEDFYVDAMEQIGEKRLKNYLMEDINERKNIKRTNIRKS